MNEFFVKCFSPKPSPPYTEHSPVRHQTSVIERRRANAIARGITRFDKMRRQQSFGSLEHDSRQMPARLFLGKEVGRGILAQSGCA